MRFYVISMVTNKSITGDSKYTYIIGMFGDTYYLVPLYDGSSLVRYSLMSIYTRDQHIINDMMKELMNNSHAVKSITGRMKSYICHYMDIDASQIEIVVALP